MGHRRWHTAGGHRFHPLSASAFDRDANAFPSPRSWEFVSRILDSGPDPSVEHEMFAGAAGTGAATEFSGFLRMFRDLPNIDAILLNPRGEPVPDSPQYAVASALAHRASDTNFDRICLYLTPMPTEFRVLSARDAILRDQKIKCTAGYHQAGHPEPQRTCLVGWNNCGMYLLTHDLTDSDGPQRSVVKQVGPLPKDLETCCSTP